MDPGIRKKVNAIVSHDCSVKTLIESRPNRYLSCSKISELLISVTLPTSEYTRLASQIRNVIETPFPILMIVSNRLIYTVNWKRGIVLTFIYYLKKSFGHEV